MINLDEDARNRDWTKDWAKKAQGNDPVAAFVGAQAEALDLLQPLSEGVDDHLGTKPETLNWGHVGEVEHVVARLREIAEFLGRLRAALPLSV